MSEEAERGFQTSAPAAVATPDEAVCRITAKQWDTVALWSWNVLSENCGICKGSLADTCVDCQTNSSSSTSKHAELTEGGAGRGPRSSWGATNSGSSSGPPRAGSHEGRAGSTVITAGAVGTRGGVNAASSTSPSPPLTTSSMCPAVQQLDSYAAALPTCRCPIAWAQCQHVFHKHCIARWLAHSNTCPLCGREWSFYKMTSNE